VGNCIATIVVAHWDHALDRKKLDAQIGIGAPWTLAAPRPAE
jgi:hypothetical protein